MGNDWKDLQEGIDIFSKGYLTLLIGVLLIVSLFSIGAFIVNRSVRVADNAVLHYEEFQEIFNTTKALNQKLCNLKSVEDADPMFKDISKAAQMNGLRNTLTRWIEEYNAKSKMWNRSLWKSESLPYQLSTADFNCY